MVKFIALKSQELNAISGGSKTGAIGAVAGFGAASSLMTDGLIVTMAASGLGTIPIGLVLLGGKAAAASLGYFVADKVF